MNYKTLTQNLEIEREIEFKYESFVSIPNCGGFWYLYYTNGDCEVDLCLAEFSEKKKLIEEVS